MSSEAPRAQPAVTRESPRRVTTAQLLHDKLQVKWQLQGKQEAQQDWHQRAENSIPKACVQTLPRYWMATEDRFLAALEGSKRSWDFKSKTSRGSLVHVAECFSIIKLYCWD